MADVKLLFETEEEYYDSINELKSFVRFIKDNDSYMEGNQAIIDNRKGMLNTFNMIIGILISNLGAWYMEKYDDVLREDED